MIKRQYNKAVKWIEKNRFSLLLAATILVLVLPAFSGRGIVREILFVASMSFLFIQSMVVATTRNNKRKGYRYFVVVFMSILFWIEPFGLNTPYLDIIRMALLVLFFVFVTISLVRFMRKAGSVNVNVLMTAVNIYLLMGIISSSFAFLFYKVYPGAYNFPSHITEPNFVTFNYYSFITMSTVGYGDITPAIPQTQTIAYLNAISGQLYVAIIMAFLVGKLLVHQPDDEK